MCEVIRTIQKTETENETFFTLQSRLTKTYLQVLQTHTIISVKYQPLCVSDVIPGVRPKQLGSSLAAQSKANTQQAALEQKN